MVTIGLLKVTLVYYKVTVSILTITIEVVVGWLYMKGSARADYMATQYIRILLITHLA